MDEAQHKRHQRELRALAVGFAAVINRIPFAKVVKPKHLVAAMEEFEREEE